MRKFFIMALLALSTSITAQEQKRVTLKSEITMPQPMTGLVLWPDQAADLNETYGKSIQLEFAYCLPCKVVT